MTFFPKRSLPAAVGRLCLREQPAGNLALAAQCRGCLHCSRVLGAQIFPGPSFLSFCQNYGSNGSFSGYSGSQEPCISVCWLCSSLNLLALPLLNKSKRGSLNSQDQCLACIQLGIYRHPQVLFGRFPIQLLTPRALHWILWRLLLLPTFPICLPSHRAVMLAEPCSVCRTSVPVFLAERDRLGSAPGCAGQVVFL